MRLKTVSFPLPSNPFNSWSRTPNLTFLCSFCRWWYVLKDWRSCSSWVAVDFQIWGLEVWSLGESVSPPLWNSFLGFVVGLFLNPFPLFSRLAGLLLSLVPLFLRSAVRAWSVGACLELSCLLFSLPCLELLGLEVRASYNPILMNLSSCRLGLSMLNFGVLDACNANCLIWLIFC